MAPRARSTASRRRKKQKVQQPVSTQATTQALPAAGPPYQASHGQGLANVTKLDPNKIGFSDLPPELRNNIYDYALVAPEEEAIPIANFPGISNLHDLAYNLVNTCRAIQDEARPFFYGQNIFRIDLVKVQCRSHISKEMKAEIDEGLRGVTASEVNQEVQGRYISYGLHHLSPALASMSATHLVSIKTFVFAIRTPRDNENVTTLNIAREPEGLLQLQLFEEGPPFVDVIDRRVEMQSRSWRESTFGKTLKDMILVGGLRAFGKYHILQLARTLLQGYQRMGQSC